MNRCPITYEKISKHETYSQQGLRQLSPQLNDLSPLALSAEEQRQKVIDLVGKMSIQGVQPKLSAQLKVNAGRFAIVTHNGHYILKPQSDIYPELPENEAITMSLAKLVDLEVPVHGLVYSKDNSMTYFIKRFDRAGSNKKLAVEDFAQLSGEDRHTKYNSSMEKVTTIIKSFCTFPKIEYVKLLKLTLFNFLIGNEDMHLKNFSLITKDNKVILSPCYDLLNTTIALKNAKEEIALPLKGKKNNLSQRDFLHYFAAERLELNDKVIADIIQTFQKVIPEWIRLINISFLSAQMRERYLKLLEERCQRLCF